MKDHTLRPARSARPAAMFFALGALALAGPLAAQLQPQKPAPSLTPQQAAPPSDSQSPSTPAARAATPAPTPATLAKGKEIVLAAAKAAGGDSLKNVKSVEVHVSGHAETPGGSMDLSLKVVVMYPDHFRSDAELPIGTITQGFDGKGAWVRSPQGIIDLPEEFTAEVARGIALTGAWGLYQQALDGKIQVQYLDDEEFDGKKTKAVVWSAPNGPVKLYFDSETHLLIGAHFRAITPQGDVQADQHWSDFRAVEGNQYPFHNQVDHDGQRFTETSVSEVKINTNPDPAIFIRPAEEKPAT